mgnify:CR=1 FL=1
MASSASTLLKLELQGTGDNTGTWGTKANTVFSRIEESVADISNISLASLGGANYTLDDTQYAEHDDGGNTSESHVAMIKATGTLTAAEKIIVPLRNKHYMVWNATSGAFAVTIGGATGGTVTIPQDTVMKVFCDGTNVEAASVAVDVAGNIRALTSILDSAGLQQIIFAEVASAVNELTITNAATGTGPQIAATGDDTNIDIELIPKGTGGVQMADALIKRPVFIDYGETVNIIGSTGGGTQDIDLTLGNVVTATVDTSANTFTFSNPPATGALGGFTLILTNGSSQTVAWPAAVDWEGGTAPTLTAAGVDVLSFFTVDGGTIWYGFTGGLAFA